MPLRTSRVHDSGCGLAEVTGEGVVCRLVCRAQEGAGLLQATQAVIRLSPDLEDPRILLEALDCRQKPLPLQAAGATSPRGNNDLS